MVRQADEPLPLISLLASFEGSETVLRCPDLAKVAISLVATWRRLITDEISYEMESVCELMRKLHKAYRLFLVQMSRTDR
jgi:hypothetical protein